MKEDILKLIDLKFEARGDFYTKITCHSGDGMKRINSFVASITRLDKFLEHLGKRIKLVDIKPKTE